MKEVCPKILQNSQINQSLVIELTKVNVEGKDDSFLHIVTKSLKKKFLLTLSLPCRSCKGYKR